MTADLWSTSVSEHRARQAGEIAAVALRLVTDQGMVALTMSAIAESAGISRQTLYRYYPDVGSVLTAAVRMSTEAETEVERLIAEAGSPSERLDAFMKLVFDAAVAGHPSPEQLEGSLPPEARAEVTRHTRHFEDLLAGILDEGVADGSFTQEIDPSADARIINRFIQAAYSLVDEEEADAGMTERLASSVRRMVRPSG